MDVADARPDRRAGRGDVEVGDRARAREYRPVALAQEVDRQAGRPGGALERPGRDAALAELRLDQAAEVVVADRGRDRDADAEPRQRGRGDRPRAAERHRRLDVLLGLAEARDDVAGEDEVRVRVADHEDLRGPILCSTPVGSVRAGHGRAVRSGRIPRRMSRPSDRRRAAVIVIDACGAGALPDAAAYGDPADANTIAHVAEDAGGLHLPTLEQLGLGSIVPVRASRRRRPRAPRPPAPAGPGKDSTTGHWEPWASSSTRRCPPIPDGFPPGSSRDLEQATACVLRQRPADGLATSTSSASTTCETGEVILYTSADSVLQLAAHDDVVPEPELYAVCRRRAR